uniref:F-box associated beta-propeller type 1 domain-containing protein n=1 Tax=Brassica campestris TaxID=3711 RepID=M4DL66_BRACM
MRYSPGCQKWNTSCKNRIFLGKEAAAKKQFLMMNSSRISLMNLDLPKDDGSPSIEQVSVLDQIQISEVFHCDGLLLCVLEDSSRPLLVWNPYLGQTRWIEPRHCGFHSSDRFALGYDKILRISNEIHPITTEHVLGYDFTSSSWKVLDGVPPERQIGSYSRGVALKGNTYFRASVVGSVLCFDFTAESFGPLLPLPLPPFHSYHGLHFLSFSCVREEDQLAVLYQHWNARETIEISVTDKIGPEVVSWTKFLKAVTGYWVDPTAGSFLVDEEKKIAVVFVLERLSFGCLHQTAHVFGQDGYFKSVRIREAPYLWNDFYPHKRYYPPLCCSSYLPSLLQLQST